MTSLKLVIYVAEGARHRAALSAVAGQGRAIVVGDAEVAAAPRAAALAVVHAAEAGHVTGREVRRHVSESARVPGREAEASQGETLLLTASLNSL